MDAFMVCTIDLQSKLLIQKMCIIDRLYKELRMMSLNCQTKDAVSKSKAGGWRYDRVGLGMKRNMADVNAAIGLAQIRERYNSAKDEQSLASNSFLFLYQQF